MNRRLALNTRYLALYLLPVLLGYFLLTTCTAAHTSLTVDEGLHIASGYTILRTGDYRLVEEHPPLVKLWLALPLLPISDLSDPRALPAWAEAATPTTESLPLLHMAQQLLYPYDPPARWLLPARWMEALLGVLLLAGIARWAGDAGGVGGSLVATLLAAADPNLLAHGAVAGTDMGATTLILLGLFAGGRFLQKPTPRRAVVTGVLLGGALAAKLTAALLGPALGLAALGRLYRATPPERRILWTRGGLVLLLVGLTFWAVYGFQVRAVPGLPIPLPAGAHAIPILRLQGHVAGGHPAYLLGEHSPTGWWVYFPLAFLLKTPLPALLLGMMGLGAWLYTPARDKFKSPVISVRWLFAGCYLGASLTSTLNIGYRHLLPLLPLLYIGIGQAIPSLARAGRRPALTVALRGGVGLLLLTQGLIPVRLAPDFLSYFNGLAGGPRAGWRYLADSNTDWGQGYQALARFQQARALPTLRLSAFIFYDPALYGVDYTPLTPLRGDTPAVFPARFAPPAGHYALSATPLDGIPLADPEMYDWFRWRTPDAQVANVLHYYHVTAEETGVEWVAQCLTPTAPLDAVEIAAGFGRADLRQFTFDCTQAWIIPGAGAQPGVYVLHGDWLADTLAARLHYAAPPILDAFIAQNLADARLSYRQRAYRRVPAFALYRRAPGSLTLPESQVWSAPAGAAPDTLLQQPPHNGAQALAGPLRFLGVTTQTADAGLDVQTWWQVTGPPPERPLSIMAHLLTREGAMLAGADGLGVPPEIWQVDDIVIQRHRFTMPENAPTASYLLRTGVYWLDDGTRWPIIAAPGDADALFVPLSPSN